MNKHYDIGVVGCWYWGNYGSLLNGYSTYLILKSLGLSVLNIVTPNNGFEPHTEKLFNAVYPEEDISPVLPFKRVPEFNDNCDMFLTGSDQIWKNNQGDESELDYSYYFRLNFAEDKKKKVSFATSFGNYTPEDEKVQRAYKNLLQRYSSISVREDEAVQICHDYFGIEATQVMEPVLNVGLDVWHKLAEYSEYKKEEEPYIITYILDPTPEKAKAIQYYSDKLGIKAINILDGFIEHYQDNKNKLNLPNTLPNVWCADLIKYFINSSFVISDSFHGTTFALMFNKPFISITNIKRGINRFETILNKVNLTDRIVDEEDIPQDDKFLSSIDFSYTNKILEDERVRSVAWLKSALLGSNVTASKIKKTVVLLPEKLCMGCGACMSVCTKDAVKIDTDKYGVYKAQIDDTKCIKCGLCYDVCAATNLPNNLNCSEPLAYAFICKDKKLLLQSSSGGAFSELAKVTLRNGGSVAGVSWNDEFNTEHIIINTIDDLTKLQKSKYLQSYLGNIFNEIKILLNNNKNLLFSGCPCQVAGLKKFLGKNYSNLLLVDIICAQCPSAGIFKKYFNETFEKDTIKSYNFRHKLEEDKVWQSGNIIIKYKNGNEEIKKNSNEDKFYVAQTKCIIASAHCRNCNYQGLPRFGDLTIGDCWGIQDYDKTIDASKGVSVILVNNTKGEDFLNLIPQENISVKKIQALENIMKYNVLAFQKNRIWPENPERNRVLEAMLIKTFIEALEEVEK